MGDLFEKQPGFVSNKGSRGRRIEYCFVGYDDQDQQGIIEEARNALGTITCDYCGSVFRAEEEWYLEHIKYFDYRILIQKTYRIAYGDEINPRYYWMPYIRCFVCGMEFPYRESDEVRAFRNYERPEGAFFDVHGS